jgi:hypothetical protein
VREVLCGFEGNESTHAMTNEVQPIATQRIAIVRKSRRVVAQAQPNSRIGIGAHRMPSLLQATLHEAHCNTMHPKPVDEEYCFA